MTEEKIELTKYDVKLNAFQLGFLHSVLRDYCKNNDLEHGADIAESIDEKLMKIIKTFYEN